MHQKYGNSSKDPVKRVTKYLKLINDLRHAKTEEEALPIVANEEITIDSVPPILLKNSYKIWLHLIPRMTPEQLIPLINRLSRFKMFKHPEIVTQVVTKLSEELEPTTNPMEVYITRKRYEEAPK
jgi:hypothetical protein